jgi:dihydrofolate reductase
MKRLSIIAAMDRNRVIGKDNQLPWRLPNDLSFVQEITMGHAIVLGRKNYESIGKALPGRRNIIMTRDKDFKAEGCEISHSIEDVMLLCRYEEEVYIFGGAEIYYAFLPYVDRMYLTHIDHDFEGDTFFPIYNETLWREVDHKVGVVDQKNRYNHIFLTYDRIPQISEKTANANVTTWGIIGAIRHTRMDIYRHLLHSPNIRVIDPDLEYCSKPIKAWR